MKIMYSINITRLFQGKMSRDTVNYEVKFVRQVASARTLNQKVPHNIFLISLVQPAK